jgi:hypothetical protein
VRTSVEPATVALRHEDGGADTRSIDMELLPRDAVSGVLPSFLGRDILQNYRLFMSIAERELRLEPLP